MGFQREYKQNRDLFLALKKGTRDHDQLKGALGPARIQSLKELWTKGACLSLCANYLVNRLVDHGDFWSWIADYSHKFAVVSMYLDEPTGTLLPPLEMQAKFTTHLNHKGLVVKDTKMIDLRNGGWADMAPLLGQHLLTSAPGVVCKLYRDNENDTAHAIAVVRMKTVTTIFDPEFGEATCSGQVALSGIMLMLPGNGWRTLHSRWDKATLYFYGPGAAVVAGHHGPPSDVPPPPKLGGPPPDGPSPRPTFGPPRQ